MMISNVRCDEKTPLLPKKSSFLYGAKQLGKKLSEKNTNSLTQDWLLAGVTSDEELTLKRKSNGFHTDDQDGVTFEGDIEVLNIKKGEEVGNQQGNQGPKNPFARQGTEGARKEWLAKEKAAQERSNSQKFSIAISLDSSSLKSCSQNILFLPSSMVIGFDIF
jgi:hypothetical protein